LKLDKFGNLIFIEASRNAIMRIPSKDLNKVMALVPRPDMKTIDTNVSCEVLYSKNTTSYIYSLQGLTLEREYLYWTNSHIEGQTNIPVAKAFAEPFIKKVPMQTFAVNVTSGARNLAANSAFLFIEILGNQDGNRLVALNKHGYTVFYFDLNVTLNPNTSALITYRDDLLFIVEPDHVSYIDVSRMSFNPLDSFNPVTKVQKQKLFSNLLDDKKNNTAVGMIVISRGR
jgi:hypothetical protein